MDHLVDRNIIELVRDLHEMSRTTMLLVGEEHFPRKLAQRSERFYNRVLVWVLAQACSREDARSLAEFYVAGVDVEAELLERVREVSRGVVRTVCVNLDAIRAHCQEAGLKRIGLNAWGKRDLYSTEAPRRPV
jgi:vacuolar-type H+-ATPase catalytic subunit A/Vma1